MRADKDMDGRLERIVEELESSGSLDELQYHILALREYWGVKHVVYTWMNVPGMPYGCGSYSQAWVERYLEKSYARHDPVVVGCFQRFNPVDWKTLDWSSKPARELLADALAHGLGTQGLTVPIRGPKGQFALFVVNDDRDDEAWAAFRDAHKSDVILCAHYFNEKALEFQEGDVAAPLSQLSPREVEALQLLAQGLSRGQAATQLSISEHTLRVYIESARHKLGAINTTHAVARAINRGIIAL